MKPAAAVPDPLVLAAPLAALASAATRWYVNRQAIQLAAAGKVQGARVHSAVGVPMELIAYLLLLLQHQLLICFC
jgi:hypothetical protein